MSDTSAIADSVRPPTRPTTAKLSRSWLCAAPFLKDPLRTIPPFEEWAPVARFPWLFPSGLVLPPRRGEHQAKKVRRVAATDPLPPCNRGAFEEVRFGEVSVGLMLYRAVVLGSSPGPYCIGKHREGLGSLRLSPEGPFNC